MIVKFNFFQLDNFVITVNDWAQLNEITYNVINRLMGSNLSRITSPKLHFHS
jgi:hypothetical protein